MVSLILLYLNLDIMAYPVVILVQLNNIVG